MSEGRGPDRCRLNLGENLTIYTVVHETGLSRSNGRAYSATGIRSAVGGCLDSIEGKLPVCASFSVYSEGKFLCSFSMGLVYPPKAYLRDGKGGVLASSGSEMHEKTDRQKIMSIITQIECECLTQLRSV